MSDNNEDIRIDLGESVRRHIENKRSPLEDRDYCAVPYDQPGQDLTPVFVSESVMRAIEAQVLRDKDREVGGVLLGGFYRTDKGAFVEVTDFIPAESTHSTDVSLTFTHETWEKITKEQAARDSDAQIVGWYHSHPALGVFMSREDEFIHSSFFTDPWHVAMVVDPIYHNWGCFKWNDGALVRTSGFYVFGGRKSTKRVGEYVKTLSAARKPAPQSASAAADRTPRASFTVVALWAAIVLLLISQIATSHMFFTRKPPSLNRCELAKYLLEKSDISGARQYLSQEIAENPENGEAYRIMLDLHEVMSAVGHASAQDDLYDRINLMLASADKLASTAPEYNESDEFEGLLGLTRESKGYRTSTKGIDPAIQAFETYKAAASSHSARLNRAKMIAKVAESLQKQLESEAAKQQRRKNAWYAKAVDWLEEENLRRIAYGMICGDNESKEKHKHLSPEEKKRVNNIRSRLNVK